MPDTITHILFAEKILKDHLKDVDQTAFYLGNVGPDPLFYYSLLLPKKNRRAAGIASRMHKTSLNRLHPIFEEYIKSKKNKEEIKILDSYLKGFIAHFVMDSTAHPYINKASGIYKNGHKRFEMNIDILILQKLKGISVKDFQFNKYLRIESSKAKLIADMMAYVVQKSQNMILSPKIFIRSLKHMNNICSMFKDRFKLYYLISIIFENLTKQKDIFRHLFYSSSKKDTVDYMNYYKMFYPLSFIEIFEDAYEKYIKSLKTLPEALVPETDFSGTPVKT